MLLLLALTTCSEGSNHLEFCVIALFWTRCTLHPFRSACYSPFGGVVMLRLVGDGA